MTRHFTSREFNQDASRAKRAATNGPVFITDRGRPAHVLLTVEHYRQLSGNRTGMAELLAADDDINFDPPRVTASTMRAADFD